MHIYIYTLTYIRKHTSAESILIPSSHEVKLLRGFPTAILMNRLFFLPPFRVFLFLEGTGLIHRIRALPPRYYKHPSLRLNLDVPSTAASGAPSTII